MAARRTALLVGFGLVAAAAGFGAGSPSARAAVVTNSVSCVPPPLNGPAFTWQPQVELTVAPVKDAYAVGDVVTVTWNWKTPPRNPSSWVLVAQNSARPAGVVRLTGAQTGDVAVAGPTRNPAAWGSDPLYVEAMTGTFTVAKEGRVDLAPAGYTIDTWLVGDPSACTPTGTPAVSTAIAVGDPSEPPLGGTSGGATGGADGGTSSGGSTNGGTTGGTSGGATPPPDGAPTAPTTTGTPGSPDGTPATGTPGASTPPAVPGAEPLPGTQPAGAPTPETPETPEGAPGAAPGAPNSPRPAGPLYITPSQDGGVILGASPSNGSPGEVTGELRPLTVTDDRGSTLGWTLTGQIGDFVAPDGSVLPGSAFHWIPGCTAAGDGSSAVSGGLPGDARTNPELLCRQNPSLGEVTGGEFQVDASVRITLPAPAEPQPYAAQLTLTLI
ncbi:hypothetical protein LO772_21420 [Yinghuangia sp. ASG 101]|uniref:hypothetical protein n=1 Tax=Yinghuangia sp. ASG 101 TaxID=2896848 RepID=UPI001E50AFAD|nr:hypothetical protein [Yinghuangia sp. ASG 101]UGQ09495.1 hypothetical protein LO772_21420 [Yinghuangia sp. ASG 101]